MNVPSALRFLLLLPAVVTLGLASGCGGSDEAASGPEAIARMDRYEMTGRVASVNPSADGLDRVAIDHDVVPGFRDLSSGEVVGMPAMRMPFPLAEGVLLPAPGDAVSFTLLVDGVDRGGLPYVIESLDVGPAEDGAVEPETDPSTQ